MESENLRIGDLARRSGVAIDTIRYYEREGLLAEPPRRASGYRAYPGAAVTRLRFIRRAKALGFSLAEIGELLSLSKRRDVAAVKRAAQRRLDDIERRIAELRRVKAGLGALVAHCPGAGAAEDCPIIAALGGEGGKDE